mmetsp:Transcript_5446/g.15755  ORF Transcript_5446/g.15755 Transcript_5446/m.15755 type:complete len:318 (-) Transcript_5446:731-1684(-)
MGLTPRSRQRTFSRQRLTRRRTTTLRLPAAASNSSARRRPRCPLQALWRRTAARLRCFAWSLARVRRHQPCSLTVEMRSCRKRWRSFRTRNQTCKMLIASKRRLRSSFALRARSTLCIRTAARTRRRITVRRRAASPRPVACSRITARTVIRKRFRNTCRRQKLWARMAALRRQLVRLPLSASIASRLRKTKVDPIAHVPCAKPAMLPSALKRTCAASLNSLRAIWASTSTRQSRGAMHRKSKTAWRWLRRMGKPARLTSIACSTPWYCSCWTTDRRLNFQGTLWGLGLMQRMKWGSVARIRSIRFWSCPRNSEDTV